MALPAGYNHAVSSTANHDGEGRHDKKEKEKQVDEILYLLACLLGILLDHFVSGHVL